MHCLHGQLLTLPTYFPHLFPLRLTRQAHYVTPYIPLQAVEIDFNPDILYAPGTVVSAMSFEGQGIRAGTYICSP